MAKKRPPKAQPLSFRNRRGEQVDVAELSATTAKNNFGEVLEQAVSRGAVAITRHDRPRAVLLSVEEFAALIDGRRAGAIDTLTAEFDTMLDRMQVPGQREAMQAAFSASPAELGKAAMRAAARKRRG